MFLRIVRIAIAVVVMAASLPLARIAEANGFGLDAYLLVPTCCVGYWLSLTSIARGARIGWFVFASVVASFLPAFPAWEWLLLDKIMSVVLDHAREAFLAYYDHTEAVAVVAILVVPWGFGCFVGWVTARLARRVLDRSEGDGHSSTTFNFTLRGLLMSMIVIGGLTAWLSNTVTSCHSRNNVHQQMFLTQFKGSFTTGKVELLGEPQIVGEKSWQYRGLVYYRVSAPIMKNGRKLWAVWTYFSSEGYPCGVSSFGYVEDRNEAGLPPHPYPERLNEWTKVVSLTDGEPKQTVKAEVIKAPTSARPGSTIEFTAKTDPGMQCELEIIPISARSDIPTTKFAPESGIVAWEVRLDPKFQGSMIEYKLLCRTNSIFRANILTGVISLGEPGDEQTDEREPD